MLFNSWAFLVFIVIVGGLYFSLRLRAQNVLLLAASYVFYGWWDWRFVSLLIISTLVDYTVGLKLDGTDDQSTRKRLLLASLGANLGILAFFKYFNFFTHSAAAMLESAGFEAHLPTLEIVLPVGISFYTFQTLAYSIDVYRRRLKAEPSLLNFGIYVAYFPQLVAGPIERAQHLLPQIQKRRVVTADMLASGGVLILIGFVRKVVIADVAAGYVDEAFANPAAAGGPAMIKAVLLFSLQIYGDFAGYSDIARGVSRILGIELMENFNHPYFATSITEFWHRWHISLSTWLRDYLYIPLGGNRGPRWFVYRNLMLTMLLGGLWHGPQWTFVVWGGLHGLALAANKWMLETWPPGDRLRGLVEQRCRGVVGWALTMALVGAAWVFFRADDFSIAADVFRVIYQGRTGSVYIPNSLLVGLVILVLAIDIPQHISRDHTVILRAPWPIRGAAYATAVLLLAMFAEMGKNVPFIYFQF
jgi:D-alanyl-lipoteichoic acid acyltransferase DltB (MBOAT superfamily)